jgi:uncharacterized repeat protein (TIGR01451 family)
MTNRTVLFAWALVFALAAGDSRAAALRKVPGLASIDVYERTNTTNVFNFAINSVALAKRRAGTLTQENNDFFGATGREYFDVFFSDAYGRPNLAGSYLTVEAVFDRELPFGGGGNIAAAVLRFADGRNETASHMASYLALGGNAVHSSVFNAVDDSLGTFTTLGNNLGSDARMRITLGFPSSTSAPPANLSVQQTAPASAHVTNDIVYTIHVANLGTATNPAVKLLDLLPDKLAFLSATSSRGVCTESNGVIECNIGDVPPGEVITITVAGRPVRTGYATNRVTISSDAPEALPLDSLSLAVTRLVHPKQTDLTVEIDASFDACVNKAPNKLACPFTANVRLIDNAYLYGDAWLFLTVEYATNSAARSYRIKGLMQVHELDLALLPSHTLSFYLSADDTFGPDDVRLQSVPLATALRSMVRGRTIPVSWRVPPGINPSGRRVITVVDSFNKVAERAEDNNTGVSVPFPVLP